jgi:hypothetical protein
MFTRKPRLQLEKFAINGAKRLLQHNLPGGDIDSLARCKSFESSANVDRGAEDTATGRASKLSQTASASRTRFVPRRRIHWVSENRCANIVPNCGIARLSQCRRGRGPRMVAVGSTSRLYASRYRPSTDLPRPVMYVELSRGHPVPHVMKVASHSVGRSVKFPHREKSRRPSLPGNGSAVACRLSEITAIANKMRQGRSSASASGNQLLDAGSSLMIWRSVVKTPVKARMLSDTEAIILASAILGVAWLALT